MTVSSVFYDANQVRYTLHRACSKGRYNWLFLPGGPGMDSCYLSSLLDILDLPGNVWFVDFPGNGDHHMTTPNPYPIEKWFDLLVPTLSHLPNTILVGHSFGGMFPLLFPELEEVIKGFVILHATPTLWLEEAARFALDHNLSDLNPQLTEFIDCPTPLSFQAAMAALAPYFFPPTSLATGRELFAHLPVQYKLFVWWQRWAVEHNFRAKWVPQEVPTLILTGEFDGITPSSLWTHETRFQRRNICQIEIEGGGHFSWLDNPQAVREAFDSYCKML